MPKNKDLKRLVRARMAKTGESYTAARAQLLDRRAPERATDVEPPAAEYARRAGMSDDAVAESTGRTWACWVELLDAVDAAGLPHRDIAALLREQHELPSWWAQTVAVGYERIRGLRQVGQRSGGDYEATCSRTFPVPVESLYEAFAHERRRRRWLPDVEVEVRARKRPTTVRWLWEDSTPVEVTFVGKGADKSTVQVQHGRLPSKKAFERTKADWGRRLDALASQLAT